jgi:hypothetical protein
VQRINKAVREGLKVCRLIGWDERRVQALVKVDLTEAEKRDERFYGEDAVVVFNRSVRGVEAGTKGRLCSALRNYLLVDVAGRLVTVTKSQLDRITVCRPVDVPVAPGERLHLKANRRLAGTRATNGELVTVRRVDSEGGIELEDGRVLDPTYREFLPGYAITSHGSQGKTVDYVLFSDSAVEAATNDQQWYVTISRGRRGIRIFTPDRQQLRENICRSGRRTLAMDIAEPGKGGRRAVLRWGTRVDGALRRFGCRAAELIRRARRCVRLRRNQRAIHECQTT